MTSRTNIFAAALMALVLPVLVYASSVAITLSPVSGTLYAGDTQAVDVYVVPNGTAVYTAKVTVHFPPTLLHVERFTPSSTVIPLPQPGYDLIDNAGGTIVKTVGFPKGVTSKALVGTIIFSGVRPGTAQVTVDTGSETLAVDNSNNASSFGNAQFTIMAAPAGTPHKAPENEAEKEATTITPAAPFASSSLAQLAAAVSACTISAPLWSWLLVIIAFIIGFILGRRTRRSRKEWRKEERKKKV